MAKTARMALLQLPAFSIDTAAEGLAHALRRIDEAAREHAPDLIALPEVTYPAYFLGQDDLASCGVLSPAEAADAFAEKAREHGVYIAVGLALDAHGDEVVAGGPRYTNGALLIGRDGQIVGCIWFSRGPVALPRRLSARPRPHEVYSYGLRVLPEHRRRGIGLALIRSRSLEAARLGATVSFSHVAGWNRAAVAVQLALV